MLCALLLLLLLQLVLLSWSLGHDLAGKKQCPLSVDPGMVKKPAPGNRAGVRGFAGRARGPSAPGV